MIINKLFFQKLLIAFIAGFATTFGQFLVNTGPADYNHFTKALWVGALVGAATAGVRAVLAFLPFNLVPSDAENTIRLPKPKPPTP